MARTLETPLDAWVPFQPGWVWVYHSVAVMVPLAPLLAVTREELRRYALGLALLCIPCFLCFLLFPVVGPRPPVVASNEAYAWLVSVDRPTNSFPSLHAGLVAYSLAYSWRVLGPTLQGGRRRLVLAVGLAWGSLILYSTVATKQHWVADVPAGVWVAWVAHRLAWRRRAAGSEAPQD